MENKTKFIKIDIAATGELPAKTGKYIVLFKDNIPRHYDFYELNGKFYFDQDSNGCSPEYWLKEVDDNEDQLRETLKQARDLLADPSLPVKNSFMVKIHKLLTTKTK